MRAAARVPLQRRPWPDVLRLCSALDNHGAPLHQVFVPGSHCMRISYLLE